MGKALIVLILLAGCTTARGTFCDIAKPLRPTETSLAAMSDAEVADMLAHNEKGARLCGWKP